VLSQRIPRFRSFTIVNASTLPQNNTTNDNDAIQLNQFIKQQFRRFLLFPNLPIIALLKLRSLIIFFYLNKFFPSDENLTHMLNEEHSIANSISHHSLSK
jgi:hypothetical protein